MWISLKTVYQKSTGYLKTFNIFFMNEYPVKVLHTNTRLSLYSIIW